MNTKTTRLFWALTLLIWLFIIAFVIIIFGMRVQNSRNTTPESFAVPTVSSISIFDFDELTDPDPTIMLVYEIDKSAVPSISFHDLTYSLFIGNSSDMLLSSKNETISFEQIDDTIQFTTDADTFTLTISNPELVNTLGQINITQLKHDKAWAWSHGFDDNVFLTKSIQAFEARGYRGTLYLILRDVWEDREEDWTLDEPLLGRLLANGWSVGNHSWGHECNVGSEAAYEESITLGYDRLFQLVSRSQRPDYKLISFASPCFDANYHPLILQHRDQNRSQVLFNESGGAYLLRVDSGATEPVVSEEKTATPLTRDLPVGRDGNVDVAADSILENFDWLSRNATSSQHLWYNTLSHGNNEATIDTILDYLDNNYKEEVWVAPSDEIYSYLQLRDNVIINVTGQSN